MRRNCLWVENFQLVARFSLDQRIFCTNVSKLIFSIYFIIKLYQRCRKNWSSFCGGDEKMSEENSDAICQISFNHVTSPRRFLNKFSHVLNLDDHNTWSEKKNCLWPAYYSARRKWNFFPTPLLNKATRGETEVEKKSATRLSSSETEKCVFNVWKIRCGGDMLLNLFAIPSIVDFPFKACKYFKKFLVNCLQVYFFLNWSSKS